jgi:hypothetical protein
VPDPIVAGAAALSAAVYVAKTSWDYVLKSKNGASSREEAHIKECKAEEVQKAIQRSLDDQTEVLRDVRDGVRDLATIQRERSR